MNIHIDIKQIAAAFSASFSIGFLLLNEEINDRTQFNADECSRAFRSGPDSSKSRAITEQAAEILRSKKEPDWQAAELVFEEDLYAIGMKMDDSLLILGPIRCKLQTLETAEDEQSKKEIPMMTRREWLECADLLSRLLFSKGIQPLPQIRADEQKLDRTNYSLKASEASTFSNEEKRRSFEEVLSRLIQDGNPQGVMQHLDHFSDWYDLAQDWQGQLVEALTAVILASRAAMAGGLPPARAYEMEQSFIRQFRLCRNTSEQRELIQRNFVEFASQTGILKAPSNCPPSVMKALEYIASSLFEEVSPESVAQKVSMHPAAFQKEFSRVMGDSPASYIQKLRLQQGALMLRETDLSVCEIALSLHFCSQSHFGRLFKEKYGMSPLKWRKTAGDRTDY